MNREPTLVWTHVIDPSLEMSPSPLMFRYGGAIDPTCLGLIAREWDRKTKESYTIKVYRGFDSLTNVSAFARGFDTPSAKKFQQATVTDLLELGAKDQVLGLHNFVYCLGSAESNHRKCPPTEAIDPLIFYPGLESMDGSRQMIARALNTSVFREKLIALVCI